MFNFGTPIGRAGEPDVETPIDSGAVSSIARS
jgi:hypothetical protein